MRQVVLAPIVHHSRRCDSVKAVRIQRVVLQISGGSIAANSRSLLISSKKGAGLAPIRVEDMAGVTRLSTSHFFRAFKLGFSMPLHAYARAVRLARACELLLGSDEPVSRIAVRCGFADQAHFSRFFCREMGCAPALWRRERRSPLVTEYTTGAEPLVLMHSYSKGTETG